MLPNIFVFSLPLKLIPFIVILTLMISVVVYYYWTIGRRFARQLNKIPGPRILPFIGCAHLTLNPDEVQKKLFECETLYGNFGRFWLAHIPYFITSDAAIIEKIFTNPNNVQKAESYASSFFLLGNGLVTSDPNKWKKDRRILFPSFKSSLHSDFLQSFNINSKRLMVKLEKVFETPGVYTDIHQHLGRCAMDIVFETMLDMHLNVQADPNNKLYEAYKACIDLIRVRMYKPWLRFPIFWHLFGYAKIQRNNLKIIRQVIDVEGIRNEVRNWKCIDDRNDRPQKFAHLLYLHGDNIEDIFHHFVSIVVAGFDTTSTVMNNTIYLLALHPDIQEKLRQEVDTVFKGNFDRDATMEDHGELKYMELVLRESMRFLTPTPIMGRTLGEDLELKDGIVVPKGCNVMIPSWHVHHDPNVWRQPEKFIPERFLSQHSIGRSSYSFLPFSGGLRGCMGQKYAILEMKVLLSKIIGNFEIVTNMPLSECVFHYNVVLDVKGGLPVSLIPRMKRKVCL